MNGQMTGWWALAFVVLWLLVVVLCIVVIALARQVGTLHLRLGPRGALEIDDEGPPLGQTLPTLSATGAEPGSAPVTIGGAGRPRLVLFSTETCAVCREVAPGIPAAAAAGRLEPIVVHDIEAERIYGVPGTPFVLVLDERGIVRAKGTVNNLEQVEGLVETANRRIMEDPQRWAS